MKFVLASVLALSFAGVAHASPDTVKQTVMLNKLSRATASVHVVKGDLKVSEDRLFCDPPGERCYQDDSWTCCSGVCIDSICH